MWEKGSTTKTPMRHKNGLTTSVLFFFLKIVKNLGWSDEAKRRKKEDGLRGEKLFENEMGIILEYLL